VAKAISDFVETIAEIVVTITNVVVNTVLGISELVIGGITGINFLSKDGSCRLSNVTKTVFSTYADKCDNDNGGGGSGSDGGANVSNANTPLNCYEIKLTFYIPQLNGSGYNNQCSTPIDETQSKIAIYRYSIPNNSSQSTLNDWFLNQIKTKVGNGYLVNGYHTAATDEGKIAELPYSQICTGNTCKFTDDTVPDNSYIAYGAKIIGNYYQKQGESCSWPNKFLNKDNAGSVTMSDTYKLGNAFDGPYNIGACPPKVDLKVNDQDYSKDNQNVVWYPQTDAELKWTTQKVKSLDNG
jgi:hypothetical protein